MHISKSIPILPDIIPNTSVSIPRPAARISEDDRVCFLSDPDEFMVSVLDLEKLEFIRKFDRDYSRVKRLKGKTPSLSSIKIPERKYENDIVYLYNFKGNLWVETSTDDAGKAPYMTFLTGKADTSIISGSTSEAP